MGFKRTAGTTKTHTGQTKNANKETPWNQESGKSLGRSRKPEGDGTVKQTTISSLGKIPKSRSAK